PVDRCEAHVGDLVELLQLVHHELADFRRGDLLLGPLLQRRLDAVGDRLDLRHADRPLLARLQQPRDQLLPLEAFSAAVLLDDHVGDLVDALVAREAAPAAQTLAPPTDHLPFLALARIDHLVAEMAAVRTLHAGPSALSVRANAPSLVRLMPSWVSSSTPATATGTNEIACRTSAAPTARSPGAPKNPVTPSR